MSKLNIKAIRNQGITGGLLNDESRKKVASYQEKEYIDKNYDVKIIPFNELIPNEKNHYSIEDIDELAVNLSQVGMMEPLTVYRCEDGYRIVSGHRRFYAARAAKEKDIWTMQGCPCIVKDIRSIDLPLTDQEKEDYIILSGNVFNRNYSEKDTIVEIEKFLAIVDKLRKNGINDFGGETLENDREKMVAKKFSISESTAKFYLRVMKSGTDQLKNALMDQRMKISVAAQIANRPAESQNEILEDLLADHETITALDIKKYDLEKKAQDMQKAKEDPYRVDAKIWRRCTKKITKAVKDGYTLSPDQYIKFQEAVQTIEKLFSDAES